MTGSVTNLVIRGRDETGKAFGSVQRNLKELPPAAKKSAGGLGKAFANLPQFGLVGKAISGITSALAGPAGMVAAASGAATAITGFTAGVIANDKVLATSAERTGYTASQMRLLKRAAEGVGEDIYTAEGLIETFNERIQEAAEGTGEGAAVFKELGISLTDVNGQVKSSPVLLAEYARKMNTASDQTESAAYNTRLLGGDGFKLISTLEGMEDQLESTNRSFDDQVERSAEAAKQWRQIKVSVTEFAQNAVRPLIPLVAKVLKSLGDLTQTLTQRLRPAWERIQETFGEVIRIGGILYGTVFANLFDTLKSFGTYIRDRFGPVFSKVAELFGFVGNSGNRLAPVLRRIATFFLQVSGEANVLAQRLIGGAKSIASFAEVVNKGLRGDFKGALDASKGIRGAWEEAEENVAKVRERTKEAIERIKTVQTEVDSVKTSVSEVETGWEGVGTSLGAVKDKVGEVDSTVKRHYTDLAQAETDRFNQVKRTLEETETIRKANAEAAKTRESEAHRRRLGHLDIEKAREIAYDVDVFSRRQGSIEAQREIQERAAENYRDKIREQNKEVQTQNKHWQDIVTTVKSSLSSAIQGLIKGTVSWGTALRNIGNAILDSLIKKFADFAVNQVGSLFSTIRSGFSNLLGSFASRAASVASSAAKGIAGAISRAAKGAGSAAAGAGGIAKAIGGIAKSVGPIAALAAPVALFGFLGRDRESSTDRARKRVSPLLQEARQGRLDRAFTADETTDLKRLVFSRKVSASQEKEKTLSAAGLLEEYNRIGRSNSRIIRKRQDAERKRLLDKAASQAVRKNFDFLTEEQLKQIGLRNGGIVNARRGGQLALIGEGRYNEAVVPLPNGRAIPVEIRGGGVAGTTVNVVVNIDGNGRSDAVGDLERRISDALFREIQSGGILEGVV